MNVSQIIMIEMTLISMIKIILNNDTILQGTNELKGQFTTVACHPFLNYSRS